MKKCQKEKKRTNIVCDQCKYQNKDYYIAIYGTCNLCGKVLDKKAKYKYEMRNRLHLAARRRGKNGHYSL